MYWVFSWAYGVSIDAMRTSTIIIIVLAAAIFVLVKMANDHMVQEHEILTTEDMDVARRFQRDCLDEKDNTINLAWPKPEGGLRMTCRKMRRSK